MSCDNDFLSCGNDLLTCGNDSVFCGNNFLSCCNDFLTCGNDLLSRGNELKNARKTVLYLSSNFVMIFSVLRHSGRSQMSCDTRILKQQKRKHMCCVV